MPCMPYAAPVAMQSYGAPAGFGYGAAPYGMQGMQTPFLDEAAIKNQETELKKQSGNSQKAREEAMTSQMKFQIQALDAEKTRTIEMVKQQAEAKFAQQKAAVEMQHQQAVAALKQQVMQRDMSVAQQAATLQAQAAQAKLAHEMQQ